MRECCEVRFLSFACDRRVGCAAALAPDDPRSFAIAHVVTRRRDQPGLIFPLRPIAGLTYRQRPSIFLYSQMDALRFAMSA